MKWERRKVTTGQVMAVVEQMGAPTTTEIKNQLRTDSKSIRVPLGKLLAFDKVFPISYKGAIVWMKVTGERGHPRPERARKDKGYGTPRQEGAKKRAVTPSIGSNRSTLSDKERKRLEREFLEGDDE